MGLIITSSDFSSIIATDVFTVDEVDGAIDTYEKQLIYELLGVELANLFIGDLDVNGVPQTQRFLDIFESWFKTIDEDVVQSVGMKQMLVWWVFFFYVREQWQDNSIQGNVENEGSINRDSRMSYATLVKNYNVAIKTYKAIQSFINQNSDTYPEFKGMYKEFIGI
jgi:hypothetical protein